ncbi:MAG: ROK family protein, partial [Candidatus Heimdallarchaeota archaeon]
MIEGKPNQFTLGVDLGGTKVKSALVDHNGQILAVHTHPTHPNKGPTGVIKDIIICINGCLEKAKQEAQSLGIGVAGQVDSEGVVQFAPNLNWRNVPLREKLEDQLG